MRGKHGQAAAVRHEVQERDAQIARLTHERDKALAALAATKERLAEYQTKLGAWSAEQNEVIERRIAEAVLKARAKDGMAGGYQEAQSDYDRASGIAYRQHLVDEHGLDADAANEQAFKETKAIATRRYRRRHSPKEQRPRERERLLADNWPRFDEIIERERERT